MRSIAPAATPATPPTIATPSASASEAPCPSCGHINVPGSVFCENCGVQLPQTAQPAQEGFAAQPVEQSPPPAEQSAQQPPYQPPAEPSAQEPASQTPVESPPAVPPAVEPAPADPIAAATNRLVITASNVNLQFPSGKQEVILGREDPVSGIFPDIDFDPHGGLEAGVGRQHAKITFQGAQAYIEDLNSVNGTSVNKQRIPPGQPVALNNGDEVRLGIMALTFYSN